MIIFRFNFDIRRRIKSSRGDIIFVPGTFLRYGKQIKQRLHIQPRIEVSLIDIFFTALVVEHTDIVLPVFFEGVDTVDLAFK